MKKFFTFLTLSLFWLPTFSYGQVVFKAPVVKANSAEVTIEITNSTRYEIVPDLFLKKKSDPNFGITPQKKFDPILPTKKSIYKYTFSGLTTNTEYEYKIKSTFFVVGSGEEGKPIENSPNQGFKTLLAGNRTLEVETLEATQAATFLKLEGLLKVGYTNPTPPDVIKTWFKVRNKGENEYEWKAVGNDKLIGDSFSENYQGAFTGEGCTELEYQAAAQYESVLLAAGFKPNNFGTLNFIEVSNTPNSSATGEIKLFKGGDDCEEAPPEETGPSTTGGGDEETEEPDNNTYTFLTPLPLGEGLTPQDSVEIGAGAGGVLGILQRIFTIMLVAAVVLAVVFLIIGGARYATGDTLGGKMGGRQIITNAITGLLFALLAWLLLNIVNPDLLRFTLSIPNIGKALTPGSGTTPSTGGGSTAVSEGCGAEVSKEDCMEQILADEDRVRGIFRTANIGINKDPCQTHTSTNCTNVGKLSQKVIDSLLKIKSECKCAMMITGGTEYLPHAEGGVHSQFIAVDMQIGTEPFDEFIKSKGTSQGASGVCRSKYNYSGLLFCDETIQGNDPHWHVYAVTGSGSGPTTSGGLIKFENIGVGNNGVWGKLANLRLPTETDMKSLHTSAKNKDWYAEAKRVSGQDAPLFLSLIMIESSGNKDKEKTETNEDGSFRGKSCGLTQLLTSTAKQLDSSVGNSVDEICQKLKDPTVSIRLGYAHFRSLRGNSTTNFKERVAAYNAGEATNGPKAPFGQSADCSGLFKFECPWDSSGCYDRSKPNDKPEKTDCSINDGFEPTRIYIMRAKILSELFRTSP